MKMTIYLPDFNNNMCTNESDGILGDPCNSDKVEYSENYDSDSEPLNGYVPVLKNESRISSVPENKTDQPKSASIYRQTEKKSISKRRKPSFSSFKTPTMKKGTISSSNTQMSAVDRWEAAQVALAEANSQNALLQRQLQECRVELRTVQRQCKMQSARLNKAIGQEADLPQIVDRLTADIRSLQIRLREKTSQFDASQRRISELQHRVYVLEKERAEYQSQASAEDAVQRRSSMRLDEVLAELQAEKKKTAMLTHQLDVTSRSHKHQMVLAHEQNRQMRRQCHELQNQLNERTQLLQEKIKLLELQNIYSLRLPKHVPPHLPPTEHLRNGTPDSENYPNPRTEISVHPLPKTQPPSRSRGGQLNTQKVSVNFGRSRGRRTLSYDASSQKTTDTQSSQPIRLTNPGTEMLYSLLVDPSTCESMVERYSAADGTSAQSRPSQNRSGEEPVTSGKACHASNPLTADMTATADASGFRGDQTATLSTITRDDLTIRPSPTDIMDSECTEKVENLSVRPKEWLIEPTQLTGENEEVNMIASQQHPPIDVAATTQDPTTSASSQTISVSMNKLEDNRERERKTRLIKTLDALDKGTVFHENPLPVPISTTPADSKRQQENDAITLISFKDQSEIAGDFARLNKQREQELWNELFGPETESNPLATQNVSNINRGHAGLMAKTMHNDGFGTNSIRPTQTTVPEVTKMFKSPDFIPHSSFASKTLKRPSFDKQSGIRSTFDQQDEVDSEFEEFHV